MPPAVRVEQLGKSYRLGLTHAGSVRELVNHAAARLLGRAPASAPRDPRTDARTDADGLFWALRDVSFEVQPGEVVGIIGRNGAGKSTLLKILSRITPPTTGRVELHGRVASLLEVGTGFHPELTGRENIYLNGTILGLTRAEVAARLDEIVAFAEVDQFLDTPVKRYSSGMTVRLAFAVAAHLDPEILIIDEVLAVGDAAFQRKCIAKMSDVSAMGRTVLFVSHNLGAVQKLCHRTIVLSSGTLSFAGDTPAAIRAHLAETLLTDSEQLHLNTARSGAGRVRLSRFHIRSAHGSRNTVKAGEDVTFAFHLRRPDPLTRNLRGIDIGFAIHRDSDDEALTHLYSSYQGILFSVDGSDAIVECTLPSFSLAQGTYRIRVRILADGEEQDRPFSDIATLTVVDGNFYGSGKIGAPSYAPLLVRGEWTHRSVGAATSDPLRNDPRMVVSPEVLETSR